MQIGISIIWKVLACLKLLKLKKEDIRSLILVWIQINARESIQIYSSIWFRNEFFETIVPGPTIYKDRKTLTICNNFVITKKWQVWMFQLFKLAIQKGYV
jgi:hypothetical protein